MSVPTLGSRRGEGRDGLGPGSRPGRGSDYPSLILQDDERVILDCQRRKFPVDKDLRVYNVSVLLVVEGNSVEPRKFQWVAAAARTPTPNLAIFPSRHSRPHEWKQGCQWKGTPRGSLMVPCQSILERPLSPYIILLFFMSLRVR